MVGGNDCRFKIFLVVTMWIFTGTIALGQIEVITTMTRFRGVLPGSEELPGVIPSDYAMKISQLSFLGVLDSYTWHAHFHPDLTVNINSAASPFELEGYQLPLRFEVWEEDCGSPDQWNGHDNGGCSIFESDDNLRIEHRTHNLSSHPPEQDSPEEVVSFWNKGSLEYRLWYKYYWRLNQQFSVHEETSPQEGGTGYCLGVDDIIFSTQTHLIPAEFNAEYLWRVKYGSVVIPYTSSTPVLNITPNHTLLDLIAQNNLLSKNISLTVSILVNGKVINESTPIIFAVHDSPPNLIINEIDNITVGNQGISQSNDVDIHHVQCHGGSTGKIVLKNVRSGNGQYNYYLKGPSGYLNISGVPEGATAIFPQDADTDSPGLAAGEYILGVENLLSIVSEDVGCYSKYPITILQPDPLVSSINVMEYPGGSNVSCHDAEDGSLTISASGGVGDFRFDLFDVNQNQLVMGGEYSSNGQEYAFVGLKSTDGAGATIQYYIKSTDSFGCTLDNSKDVGGNLLTLTSPDTLKIIEPVPLDANCFGVTNGGFEFRVNGGSTVDQDSFKYWALLSGDTSREVAIPDEYSIGAFDDLGYGDYIVTVSDTNQCQAVYNFHINQPPQILIDTSRISDALCFGASDGSYWVQVTGGFHESQAAQYYKYSLTHDSPPNISFAQPEPQTDTAALFQNLIAGTYTLQVRDEVQCTVDFTPIQVNSPDMLDVVVSSDTISCAGDSTATVRAFVEGGTSPYIMFWMDEQKRLIEKDSISHHEGAYNHAVLSNQPGGSHYLMVKDSVGCYFHQEGFEFIIPQPDTLKLFVEALELYKDECNDITPGFVTLSASGGWNGVGAYQFSKDDTTYQLDHFFENLASGIYTFTVRDPLGCETTTSVEVPEGTELQVLLEDVHSVSCPGDSDGAFVLDIFGGLSPYQVSIDGGLTWREDSLFFNLSPKDYTVMVTDAGHCLFEMNIPIVEPEPLTIGVIDQSHSLCNEATAEIFVEVQGGTPPYSLSWSKNGLPVDHVNDFYLNGISAGAYRAQVMDDHGCYETEEIDISDENHPTIDTIITTQTTCYGLDDGRVEIGTVTTYALTPGYTIVYDYDTTNLHFFEGQAAGNHQLFVVDSEGCVLSQRITIASPDSLYVAIDSIDQPSCLGYCNGYAELRGIGGVGGYTYEWVDSEAVTHDNTIQGACGGRYLLTLRDNNDCVSQQAVLFVDPDPITAKIPDSLTICPGSSIRLDAGYQDGSYQWTSDNGFMSQDQVVLLSNAGAYTVNITTPSGCHGTDIFYLTVSNSFLHADFLISNKVVVGDTIIAIEISNALPDSLVWDIPPGVLHESVGLFEELIFPEVGTYSIGMSAMLDGCLDSLRQEVEVYDAYEEPIQEVLSRLIIDQVMLYPNPNNGIFQVEIKLFESRAIQIALLDVGSANHWLEENYEGQEQYILSYERPDLVPGVYLLMVRAGNQTEIVRVVIQ